MKNLILVSFALLSVFVSQTSYGMAPAPFRGVTDYPPYVAPTTPNVGNYGFNTLWMHGLLNNSPASAVTEARDAMALLNQPIVRFPGGTIGNFYHFRGKDYGFWTNGQPAPAGENFIVKFADIVSSAKGKVSYVLNIREHYRMWYPQYTGTDENLMNENLDAIEYLLSRGIQIPMVEIGNELTIYPEMFGLNLLDLPNIQADQKKIESIIAPHITRLLNEIIPTYKTKINALFARYGQPSPKYGIPIHPIYKNGIYYGAARYFTSYYNWKMRGAAVDALIPHTYLDVGTDPNPDTTLAKGRTSISDTKTMFSEIARFFPGKKFWITEFNFIANDANGNGSQNVNLDGPIHVQLLEEYKNTIVAGFPVENYFLHLFFFDGGANGPIYKKVTEGYSHPINGKVVNGVTVPDPKYGKNLFYNQILCWSAKTRGSNATDLLMLQTGYGCP